MAHRAFARDLCGMVEPDEIAERHGSDGDRPDHGLPRHPWRGPLTFGVVAATLQLGGLLWIANC